MVFCPRCGFEYQGSPCCEQCGLYWADAYRQAPTFASLPPLTTKVVQKVESRPLGVTILAIVQIFFGCINFLVGAGLVLTVFFTLLGFVEILIGVGFLADAVGLFDNRDWCRWLGMLVWGGYASAALLNVVLLGSSASVVPIVIAGIAVLYLNSASVKNYVGE